MFTSGVRRTPVLWTLMLFGGAFFLASCGENATTNVDELLEQQETAVQATVGDNPNDVPLRSPEAEVPLEILMDPSCAPGQECTYVQTRGSGYKFDQYVCGRSYRWSWNHSFPYWNEAGLNIR